MFNRNYYQFLFLLSIFFTIHFKQISSKHVKTDIFKEKCLSQGHQGDYEQVLAAKSVFEKYNNFINETLTHGKPHYEAHLYLLKTDTSANRIYRKLFENFLTKFKNCLNNDELKNINRLILLMEAVGNEYVDLEHKRLDLVLFIYTDGINCLREEKDNIFECINQDLNLNIPTDLSWIDFIVEVSTNRNVCRNLPIFKCFEKSVKNCLPSPYFAYSEYDMRC